MDSPRKKMKLYTDKHADLYEAIRHRVDLATIVPLALDVLERDPLASAGFFRGALLRALIDLPANFWGDNPAAFARYQDAVRAGALARRSLPSAERMEFWTKVEL